MNSHNASLRGMGKAPAVKPEPKPEAQPEDGGAHDPGELDALKQSFDSVMQALSSGQQPDQDQVRELIDAFSSFIDEEKQESYGDMGGQAPLQIPGA